MFFRTLISSLLLRKKADTPTHSTEIGTGSVHNPPVAPPPPPDSVQKVVPDIYRYFSRRECLHGRDKGYPLTPELEANLVKQLTAMNIFRELYGKPLYINSMYRPGVYNTAAGGAKNSAHLYCLAVDFADGDGAIKAWMLNNLDSLDKAGLWMEHPKATPTWIHLQVRPVGSKTRVFLP